MGYKDGECTEVGCQEPVVPNQTVYGMPLKLCQIHLELLRDRFNRDKDLRMRLLLRSKEVNNGSV